MLPFPLRVTSGYYLDAAPRRDLDNCLISPSLISAIVARATPRFSAALTLSNKFSRRTQVSAREPGEIDLNLIGAITAGKKSRATCKTTLHRAYGAALAPRGIQVREREDPGFRLRKGDRSRQVGEAREKAPLFALVRGCASPGKTAAVMKGGRLRKERRGRRGDKGGAALRA